MTVPYQPVAAGDLNSLITIQKNVGGTVTALGSRPLSWTAVVSNIWAHINPTKGDSFWQADKVNTRITHEVTVRYQSELVTVSGEDHRVVYGTRIFDIIAVRNIEERDEHYVLLCREVKGVTTP